MNIINLYERRARYYPAVFTISPLIIFFYFWFKEIQSLEWAFLGIVTNLGLAIPLSTLARKLGNKKQDKLLIKWGSLPATQLLMHSNNSLNDATKVRYHFKLKGIKGLVIPTVEEERIDLQIAIVNFNSCIDYLIRKTRNRNDYPLVFEENVSYGRIRNLFGLKPIALSLGFILLIFQMFLIYNAYGIGWNISAVPILKIISVIFTIIYLIYFLFIINEKHVYDEGIKYGKALLETCEDLNEG